MIQPLVGPMGTILVVDDNPFVLEIVSLSLRRAGFTVLSAQSPEEARRIGDLSGTIHLLLSDVVMLHTYGTDLAEELSLRRPAMQVILMSGHPDDTPRVNYRGDFLEKPFYPGELVDKVKEVLSRAVCGRPIAAGASGSAGS